MERAHDPELKIAERYFLGELTDDEAEAFEAHYFECPRCAEYVVEELALLESGREVAKTAAPQALPGNVVPLVPRSRRREWLTAAAAAVVALVVATPILRHREPRVYRTEPMRIQFSMDRSQAAAQPAQGEVVQLDIEVPPVETPQFEVAVRNAAGEIVDRPYTYPAERTNVFLVLGALPAGTYDVVIEGVREDGNRSPIARQSFEVRGNPRKEGEP